MFGRLERCRDAAGVAVASARHFARCAAAGVARHGRFDVALAGGSTPRAAYELLAGADRARVEWGKVRFFFGDERCVPPESADSNYGMAKAALFAPLGIAASAVFRMRGEDNPAAVAAAYAQTLARELDRGQFDLVMLGMGPDGHTASLFPGDEAPADVAVYAHYVPKFSMYRLTLTAQAINAAASVTIGVSGRAKARVLGEILGEGERAQPRYPVELVRPISGDLLWIADAEALEQAAPD